MNLIVRFLKRFVIFLGILIVCASCSKVPSTLVNPWQLVEVPTEENLFDIAFTQNPQHGWIVGGGSTLLETNDGGNHWKLQTPELGEQNFRFTSVSFTGNEGWIVGEPAIVLHTQDGGKNWSRIPLSNKLPGVPVSILALGSNSAEMTTNVGAIYRTEDGGQNWKALVQEAVGVVRNIRRADTGQYVAVSAKGNFYSTWEPGQTAWTPHNRNSSRRVENMGFTPEGGLWMLARGGQVQFSDTQDREKWLDPTYPEFSTSWGLLDLAYRTPQEAWISGGSGNLLRTTDGGQTWEKDREIENLPGNLYKVTFLSPEQGYVMGQRGLLLKYQPTQDAA